MMKMNILKKIFCVFYLANLGNDRPREKSDSSLLAGIGGTWGVIICNAAAIIQILETRGIITHKSNNFIIEVMVFIFSKTCNRRR